MKMAKKFLAVALAGVLALSVLTGCGNSVKSKDVAKALTKMGIEAEQSKDMDKAAENTLTAIEAIVDASAKDSSVAAANKITLENAVKETGGKVIDITGVIGASDPANTVKKALDMPVSSNDGAANTGKQIRVALVKTEDATKDASMQAAFVKEGLVEAQTATVDATHEVAKTGKLGTAKTKDGKYMLVVIVNEVVAKSGT